MATITERPRKNGTTAYLVRIRLSRLPVFCLTFDDREEALVWAEENEWKFKEDPESYFAWKEAFFWDLKWSGRKHLKRPYKK